jgi:hypothetical protein
MTSPVLTDDNWLRLRKRLARSKFRSRFKLGDYEMEYLRTRGADMIRNHAFDLVRQRLAPAAPRNDGRQTPMRNHPVFVAQHATATCCRSCLRKWHGIKEGVELTSAQVDYVVAVITRWISEQDPTFRPLSA